MFVPTQVLLLLATSLAIAAPPSTQAPNRISAQLRDLPFQATEIILHKAAGGTRETHGRIARNSDGSIFLELINQQTGAPSEVLIFDVPHRRELILDLPHRRYRILPAPALAGTDLPLDSAAEQIRVASIERHTSLHLVRDGLDVTWQGLGVKRIAGLEAVGGVEIRRPLPGPGELIDGPAQTDETWISVDLGIALLETRHDPLTGDDIEVALTSILRSEPPPELFVIPPDFVLDANPAGQLRVGTH